MIWLSVTGIGLLCLFLEHLGRELKRDGIRPSIRIGQITLVLRKILEEIGTCFARLSDFYYLLRLHRLMGAAAELLIAVFRLVTVGAWLLKGYLDALANYAKPRRCLTIFGSVTLLFLPFLAISLYYGITAYINIGSWIFQHWHILASVSIGFAVMKVLCLYSEGPQTFWSASPFVDADKTT